MKENVNLPIRQTTLIRQPEKPCKTIPKQKTKIQRRIRITPGHETDKHIYTMGPEGYYPIQGAEFTP